MCDIYRSIPIDFIILIHLFAAIQLHTILFIKQFSVLFLPSFPALSGHLCRVPPQPPPLAPAHTFRWACAWSHAEEFCVQRAATGYPGSLICEDKVHKLPSLMPQPHCPHWIQSHPPAFQGGFAVKAPICAFKLPSVLAYEDMK